MSEDVAGWSFTKDVDEESCLAEQWCMFTGSFLKAMSGSQIGFNVNVLGLSVTYPCPRGGSQRQEENSAAYITR